MNKPTVAPLRERDITRHIAKESRSFVISVSGLMRKEDISKAIPHADKILSNCPDILADGGSCVSAPDGSWIVEPIVGKEAFVCAQPILWLAPLSCVIGWTVHVSFWPQADLNRHSGLCPVLGVKRTSCHRSRCRVSSPDAPPTRTHRRTHRQLHRPECPLACHLR